MRLREPGGRCDWRADSAALPVGEHDRIGTAECDGIVTEQAPYSTSGSVASMYANYRVAPRS
jgi:hypothetical protein